MPEQLAIPVPVDLLGRIAEALDRLSHQASTDREEPVIVRPLTRAFRMAGVGNTRGHEMIREGVFEVVSVGKRGRGITLRSIKRLAASA